MRVYCTPTQCVNLCQWDFIRVGILIRRPTDLHCDRKKDAALKLWLCPTVIPRDLHEKMKNFLQRVGRINMGTSVSQVFFSLQHCVRSYEMILLLLQLSAKTFLSHWRRYSTWCLRKITRWVETELHKKKLHCHWKVGVSGGDCTKQTLVSKNKYGKSFQKTFTRRRSTPGRNKEWDLVWLCSVRYKSPRHVETSFCKYSSNSQRRSRWSQRFWLVGEAVCRCLNHRRS